MRKFNKNKYVFSTTRGLVEVGEKLDKVRGKEISLLRKEAYLYGIHIKELAKSKPSLNDRNIALNIAFYIIENKEILKVFKEKRKVSIKNLNRRTRISEKFIKRCYEYIVLYTLIYSNSDYKNIQSYLKIVELKDNLNANESKIKQKVKGLVIKNNSRSVNVLTSTGEIKRLKKDDVGIGMEYEGVEKEFFYKNRFKILMTFIFISVITSVIFYQYNKIATVILLETTSTVKLQANKFNKVLSSYSGTEKGIEMFTEIDVNKKNVDSAILEIIEYAEGNEMRPPNGYVMTVNGTTIDTKNLEKTGEYIYENKVKLDINNNGTQLKLYTIIKNQKEEKDEQN